MEVNLDLGVLVALTALASCLYFLLPLLLGTKQDPKEPPSIPQPIPYIGHLLGIILYGTQYYDQVRYL